MSNKQILDVPQKTLFHMEIFFWGVFKVCLIEKHLKNSVFRIFSRKTLTCKASFSHFVDALTAYGEFLLPSQEINLVVKSGIYSQKLESKTFELFSHVVRDNSGRYVILVYFSSHSRAIFSHFWCTICVFCGQAKIKQTPKNSPNQMVLRGFLGQKTTKQVTFSSYIDKAKFSTT